MAELLNTKDLAERLLVTTMTIYNLCKRGMPHMRVGHRIRFNYDEVLEWMRVQKEKNYGATLTSPRKEA